MPEREQPEFKPREGEREVDNIESGSERFKARTIFERGQSERIEIYRLNLKHILGPTASSEQVDQIIRQNISERNRAMRTITELLTVPGVRERLARQTDLIGRENLDKLLAEKGRGIVTVPHMSYTGLEWNALEQLYGKHVSGQALIQGRSEARISVALQNARSITREHLAGRQPWRATVQNESNPANIVNLLNRLKSGSPDKPELVMLDGDRGDLAPPRKRLPVRFFDSTVEFPDGPAAFGRLADAPILPAAAYRSEGRLKVEFGAPIEVDRSQPAREADQMAMQQLAVFFEEVIRQHPDQWRVFRHDYWPEQKVSSE